MASNQGTAGESEPDDHEFFETKLVEYNGFQVRIVTQDKNGPCPLIAVCNVLLLKNKFVLDGLTVSADILLAHVAEQLFLSASFVDHDQDLAQAIDALPRFRTGIDVNIRFNKIDGFLDTPELAVFRLLEIPLYHGWMVDPQDSDTAKAFGSKPYNTVMNEVADFRAKNIGVEEKNVLQEDCGDNQKRKGDCEEEEALLQALKLSCRQSPLSPTVSMVPGTSDDHGLIMNTGSGVSLSQDSSAFSSCYTGRLSVEPIETNPSVSESAESLISNNQVATINEDRLSQNQRQGLLTIDEVSSSAFQGQISGPEGSQEARHICLQDESGCSLHLDEACHHSAFDTTAIVGPSTATSVNSSIDVRESIHDGEEYIPDSRIKTDENLGPEYESEVVVAKQVERGRENDCDKDLSPFITRAKGLLMDNFLKNNKNQLTIYGLCALQKGLKHGELCVFFRNNHFSTMLKHNNELYLLATDQGYISQPDLVWEKLNEVNGDTVHVTGDFNIFREKTLTKNSWDEQEALTWTNNYFASSESSALSNDEQLAADLLRKECENKLQRQPTSRLTTGPQVEPGSHTDLFDDAKAFWNDFEGSIPSPPIKPGSHTDLFDDAEAFWNDFEGSIPSPPIKPGSQTDLFDDAEAFWNDFEGSIP